jgi:hypothetical protein
VNRRARALAVLAALAALPSALGAADAPPSAVAAERAETVVNDPPLPPLPYVFTTRPGRFEIASTSDTAARAAVVMAEELWRTLATPLQLPADGFPSSIAVTLFPAAQWPGDTPFRTYAEPAGRVTARVRWSADEAGQAALRRALAQALLMRRATAARGLVPGLAVPYWLENAAVAWSLTSERPGALDRWQRESARATPPPLATVLAQRRGVPLPRDGELAALWLFAHLQSESGPEQRWPRYLAAMLGGADPEEALGRLYGEFFPDNAARELWWQVGWHARLRQSAQATDTTAETRAWLAERAAWLGRQTKDGPDTPLALDEVFAARAVPWVAEELARRLLQLRAGLPTAHPFYRNAALSLGRAYEAALAADRRAFAQAQADLARDIADGRELEQAATAALDELESKPN